MAKGPCNWGYEVTYTTVNYIKLLLKWALIRDSTCNHSRDIASWSWRMKNYVFEKNAFESLETLETTKTQCRMLYPGLQGETIVSHWRYTISLLYLPLKTGLPNEVSNRQKWTVWDLIRKIDLHTSNRYLDVKSTSDGKTNDITWKRRL